MSYVRIISQQTKWTGVLLKKEKYIFIICNWKKESTSKKKGYLVFTPFDRKCYDKTLNWLVSYQTSCLVIHPWVKRGDKKVMKTMMFNIGWCRDDGGFWHPSFAYKKAIYFKQRSVQLMGLLLYRLGTLLRFHCYLLLSPKKCLKKWTIPRNSSVHIL